MRCARAGSRSRRTDRCVRRRCAPHVPIAIGTGVPWPPLSAATNCSHVATGIRDDVHLDGDRLARPGPGYSSGAGAAQQQARLPFLCPRVRRGLLRNLSRASNPGAAAIGLTSVNALSQRTALHRWSRTNGPCSGSVRPGYAAARKSFRKGGPAHMLPVVQSYISNLLRSSAVMMRRVRRSSSTVCSSPSSRSS